MHSPRSAVGSRRRWRFALVLLPLVSSCGDRTATTELPATDARSLSNTVAASAAIFAVDPAPMTVPTYDGSGQSVHPDVVAFDSDWHGARYWLTMTPYPGSNQTLENPSILTSENGSTVAVPNGLTNPVVRAPRKAKDYNSDPELLYDATGDRLVLFYRLVEKRANTLHVSTSRDGITWTPMRAPFWEHSHQVVSPTVAPRPGAVARMWYVNAGKAGCNAKSTSVKMRVATDAGGGFVDTRWLGPLETDLKIPGYVIWHIKARWVPSKNEYWMLLSAFPEKGNGCQTDDLFFARSTDGQQWTVYSEPILRHDERDWTAAAVYRSTFTYDAATDQMRLWISARDAKGVWRIGQGTAHYSALLAALEGGRRISPQLALRTAPVAVSPGEQP
jgi:hypothetical protein